jgi:hypothetical protein
MATLTLSEYRIQPLNPDGSDSAIFPEIIGSGTPSETVDFAFMGQRFKIELTYELSGTLPDSSTYDVAGLFVRYNPAMFVEQFTSAQLNVMPTNGYTLVIPNTSASTYPMALVTQLGQYVTSNENGSAQLEVIDSTTFKITHSFRLIADTENYIISQYIDNQTKLTKNSIYATQQRDNSRPSVFNTLRSLNGLVVTQKGKYYVSNESFRVPFIASFNSQDVEGDAILPFELKVERLSDLGTFQSDISAYEDCRVTVEWDDEDEIIELEKVHLLVTRRREQANVAGYEKDLEFSEALLVTTGGSSTVNGIIKAPTVYTQAGGKTSVSFIVDHTKVTKGDSYDFHPIATYESGPSELKGLHGVKTLRSNSAALAPIFTSDAVWYSRNGKSANNITAAVMERLSNVFTLDYNTYFDTAGEPFTTFDQDFEYLRFDLVNAVTNFSLYSGFVGKNTATNEIQSNDQIQTIKDEANTLYRFVAKPFRIPFENEQGLPNLGGNPNPALNQYKLIWTLRIVGSIDQTEIVDYVTECDLEVRPYESVNNTPSYSPKVSNIMFRDPKTGLSLSAWCDLEEVLVTANIEDLGTDTYALAFVDRNPFGVIYQNDYSLEEEDAYEHELPSYVEFEMLQSDLISQFNLNVSDGVVSFLLDISSLSEDERMRISVMVYQSNS